MAPHSNTLAWKIPWMYEPVRLQSMGSQRVGHDWSNLAAAAASINKGFKLKCISTFLCHFFPLFSSLKALIYLLNSQLYFLYPPTQSVVHFFVQMRGLLEFFHLAHTYTHTHTLFPTQSSLFLDLDSGGFPGGSDGKESACNSGDQSSVPGSERSPGEVNGNPLQYSCLETPMDRGD